MIDTHAHLDMLDDADAALTRARAKAVDRVIAVGSGIDSCRRTLELAEREDGIFAALGVHPHGAGEAGDRDIAELAELLAHPRAVAVGEAGLDFYRDLAPRDRQRKLFVLQADLATELGKPLVVHTRAADEATVEALTPFSDLTVVLHCFSSPHLLEPARERGWYVSFAGNVTYPKASELRWAAAQVPADRLLAETDSPYLAPQPVRGQPNEPAHVTHTVDALARARGEEPDDLARQIDENASRAFGLA